MRRVTAVFDRPLDTFLLPLLTVVCSLVLCGVSGECPSDVQSQAYGCYTAYSIQFQNMQHSKRKMCCGVDVETLRLFCSAYMNAMQCLKQLKSKCPADRHHLIDHTKTNLKGAEQGLKDLCTYDQLYEKYARHQRCFEKEARFSESCLSSVNDNKTTNIRLLSTVNRKSIDELCRDMKSAVNCMKPNIQAMCGAEAGKLVEVLIKPMVKDSSQCDYNVVHIESTEKPQQRQSSHTVSAIGDHNKYITDNGNGAPSRMTSQGLPATVVVTLCVLIMKFLQ